MNIQLMVDMESGVQEAMTALYDMPKKIKFVIRGAVNDTAKQVKKHNDALTKQTYTDEGDIHPLKYSGGSVSAMEAVLRDKGPNVPIDHFTNSGGGKEGITGVIKTTNGGRTLGKYGNLAFYHNGISVRKTPARFPLEKMHSISSPVQHGNPTMWEPNEPMYGELFMQNIISRIEGYLG